MIILFCLSILLFYRYCYFLFILSCLSFLLFYRYFYFRFILSCSSILLFYRYTAGSCSSCPVYLFSCSIDILQVPVHIVLFICSPVPIHTAGSCSSCPVYLFSCSIDLLQVSVYLSFLSDIIFSYFFAIFIFFLFTNLYLSFSSIFLLCLIMSIIYCVYVCIERFIYTVLSNLDNSIMD